MRDKNKVLNELAKIEQLESSASLVKNKKLYSKFRWSLEILETLNLKLFEEEIIDIDDKIPELIKIIDPSYKQICLIFDKRYDRKPKKWKKKNILEFINSLLDIFGICIAPKQEKSSQYYIKERYNFSGNLLNNCPTPRLFKKKLRTNTPESKYSLEFIMEFANID